MAMRGGRGRGRGWRGGRGGAGRGGMPGLKDDDGSLIVPDKESGPPELYPEVDLPPVPELTAKDKLLLIRRTDLLRSWKASPYYIEKPQEKKRSGDLEVEKYSDKYNKKVKRQKLPLASFVTLNPYYFPEELYSDKAKKISAQAHKAGDLFNRNTEQEGTDAVLARLNQLVDMEKRGAGGGGEVAQGEGNKAEEGGDQAGEQEEVGHYDEDDDEVMEDDDYYQGEHFDDDEGYDDGYDDGGDDGAVY